MIRKSAGALALLLLLVSLRLPALGLGEIEMQSALNQPMKAAITLTSVAGVDINQIKVALASREEHERLGLSRAKVLGNFRFEVAGDGAGGAVINISSTDPVREPYLEFLLEMVWENGRMVREYTVLVDPPVTMQAVIPVAPVAPVAQAPAVAPAPAEAAVSQARPAPAPGSIRPAPARKKTADTYGPVRREEALWSIAERLRPDSDISVQQMMLALLRANPESFPDNNINNLKAGSTLTIPDRDTILALTAAQASAEARRQYDEWREQRMASSAAVEDKPVVAGKTVAEQPVVEPAVEKTAAVGQTEAQLKLMPPEGEPVAGTAGSSETGVDTGETTADDTIRQQLALAAEEIEAGKARSDELQSRVLELESQIKKMQRLLELKSEELASMQNRFGIQAEEAAAVAAGSEESAADAEQPAAADGDEVIAAVMETGDAAEAAAPEGEEPAIAQEETPATVVETAGETGSEARGIVNRLMDNPVLAGLGVLVAILIGGFIWGTLRKQGSEGMFDNEPTLDRQLAAQGKTEAAAAPVPAIRDPGRFDEAIMDDLEVTSSEVASDPLTEADVYLAYGRVHQAEDVLQAALRDDPENLAVRAKLLEVFHAAGNVAAFNIAAGEYRELASEDDDQWSRIAAWGYELSPGNELYSQASQAAAEAETSIDFDMDLSGLDDLPEDDRATTEAEALPESFEFSLDEIVEDELQEEGLLASTDEIATKLDLARAYLDMDDPEGARSILEEVLEEGNAEQINEAESLIAKIV